MKAAADPARGHDRRVAWIDAARGIGIILVVYAHAIRGLVAAGLYPATPAIMLQDSLIYAFHMPLFFFLSGLFTRPWPGDRAGFVSGRLRALAYPYVLWSLLQGSLTILASGYVNHPLAWANLASIAWLPIAQFWFLYALLLCQLCLLLPRRWFFALVPVALAANYFRGDANILFRACGDLPFFALGVWLGGGGLARQLSGRGQATALAVVGVLVFAGLSVLADGWSARPLTFSLSYALALAGTAAALGVAALVGGARRLRALGVASMPIFLMHVIFSACARVAPLWAGVALPPVVLLVLVTLVGLGGPYLVFRAAERHGLSVLLGFRPAKPGQGAREPQAAASLS